MASTSKQGKHVVLRLFVYLAALVLFTHILFASSAPVSLFDIHVHWPKYGPDEPPLTTVFATEIWPASIIVLDNVNWKG